MKIHIRIGWWLEDTSFVWKRNSATEIATIEECRSVVRHLLEIPSLEPNEIIVSLNDGTEIRADKWFRKVPRWQLLRELPVINLGGKGKNLKRAKDILDYGDTICVNGCEIWDNGKYYCWNHYGSSANRRTLDELRFIFSKIACSEDYTFSIVPTNLGNWEIREVA